jgi:hypothetical protein
MKNYLLLLALVCSIASVSAQNAGTCGFTHKKVITIQGSQITGGAHTDFPILIDHTDGANLTTGAAKVTSASGFDIIFADDNGDLLDFQLESYNGTTGNVVAWVKIPSLTNGTDVDIHMLYGKASIVTDQSSTSTWDANFDFVLHMNNNVTDATANGNNGTNNGTTSGAGQIANGRSFDGTNDDIALATFSAPTNKTYEMWIQADNLGGGNSYRTLLEFANDAPWYGVRNTGVLELFNVNPVSTGTITTGATWFHVAYTSDNGSNISRVFINGVQSGANGTANTQTTTDLGIGHNSGDTRWDGMMDEVRIHNTARSTNWIATSYAAQNNPEGTFYTISAEINNAYTTTGNGDWDAVSIWGSPAAAPHVGADVTINRRVDIDVNSADYTVCNCTLTNATGSTVDLDMDDARVLTIIEDLTLTNSNISEVDITLDDNGTSIIVLDDLIMTNSSTFVDADVQIDLDNGTVLDIGDDVTMNATAGDLVEIDLGNTADMDVGGDVLMDHDGGDDIFFDLSSNATLDIVGTLTMDMDGGDDVLIDVDDNAVLTVGHLDIDNNSTSTDADVRIRLNVNSGAGSAFNIGGNLTADHDGTDDSDIRFELYGGDFTVTGTSTLTRRDDAHRVLFELFSGNFTSGAFTFQNNGVLDTDHDLHFFIDEGSIATINGIFTIDQNGGDDYEIDLDDNGSTTNNSQFIVTNNFIIDHDGGDNGRFVMSGANSVVTVGGDVDINHNNTSDSDILFDLNDGTFTVTGSTGLTRAGDAHELFLDLDGADYTTAGMRLNNQGTDDTDHSIWVDADQASVLTINGNVGINQTGGHNTHMYVNESAGNTAQMDINGTFAIDHDAGSNILLRSSGNSSIFDISSTFTVDHDGGGLVEIQTNGTASQFNIGGISTINWNDGLDTEFEFDANGGTITLTGALTATRALSTGRIQADLDGGNLTFSSGSTFNSGGALFTNGAIDFRVDAGSVFTNTGAMAVNMTGGDDFNIFVDVDGAGTTSQWLCTGTLTVIRSAGDDIELFADDDNSLIDIDGSLVITTSGGEEVNINLNNDATLDVATDVTITATQGEVGNIFLQGTGAPSFDVGNDFTLTISAGDDDYEIDINGGEMTVGRDMTLTESTGANELHLDMEGGDLSVTRDFFGNLSGASATGELLLDVDNGSIVTVGNDMELDISGGNDLELHLEENNTTGSARLNITGNLTLDHNGATGGDDIQFIINDDAQANIGGVFTMDTDGSGGAGNFYTQLDNSALLNVDGNIVMTSTAAGFLEIELNNTSKLEIEGNFVRAGAPNNFGLLDCNGTSTVEYNSSTAVQRFAEDAGAGSDNFDYQNVIINNTFGTVPQITMEGLATVHGDITFTDGIISSTAANLLVIDDDSDALTESDISYVDGPVKKIGNDVFDFPVGDDGQLQPLSITAPGNATDEFTAQYIEVDPDPTYSDASLGPGLNHISSCEYWELDQTAGASNVQVTLNYDPNSCGVSDLAALVVARWDGAAWQNHGGTVTGNLVSGIVQTPATVNTWIANMPFTLASTNSLNPLPIELLSFDAEVNNRQVDLSWVTATETDNDYFTVERSKDGLAWEDILEVDGAGTSSSILSYFDVDENPYTGISYYRLRQTDFDFSSTHSDIVAVEILTGDDSGISIYPNPANGNETFNIALDGFNGSDVEVIVHDIAGKRYFSKVITSTQDRTVSMIDPAGTIPAGVYMVTVTTNDEIYSQRLIVQ